MGCCCLPPDRGKLAVNSKKETNSRVKMGKGSRWASVILPPEKSQNGPRVIMGFVIYPLKVSKWDKDHYGLLLFTP